MLLFPWWISVSCLERGSPKFSVHVVIPLPPPCIHPHWDVACLDDKKEGDFVAVKLHGEFVA